MSAEISSAASVPSAAASREKSYREGLTRAAYRFCRGINRAHYENFPVASLLLPRRLRPAVDAIYAFSRMADDFADEPRYRGEGLRRLDEWEKFLDDPEPTHPVFIALQDAARRHDLPKSPFTDLLKAFRQDVLKNRYADFAEVEDYCRHSANPVGRLVLRLFKRDSEANLAASDAVCTALQLANFWQDVAVDLEKNRIYLPQDEITRFGVTEADLRRKKAAPNFKELLSFQVARTREIFRRGHALGLDIPGRLGLELRLTWLGGWTILDKISSIDFDVLARRPTLDRGDFLRLFAVALNRRAYGRAAS